jgi:hypothetical protein
MSAITMKMDVLIAKFNNQHTLAQILPEVNTRMDNTQPLFNNGTGSTPQHNPNAKSNMDLGKQLGLNSKDKQFGYKKQISVALPDFDRLQEDETSQQSRYLILPEYQSEQIYSGLLTRLLAFK